jgi:DNA (cytosine-5)-methyltransferase 1
VTIAYYNEFDPPTAQWLRELIKAGLIAPGYVDERSITDVRADDLVGYTQWHFFAGIGGWSRALRLAGWPDDRPVLTGSPPCQPFSTAGKQLGKLDERHLAPHFLALVAAIRPPWVFGEQVAAAVNKDAWLDDLLDALENEGYATGAAVSPACGVGAAHIRQRLWFTARLGNAIDTGLEGHARHGDNSDEPGRLDAQPGGPVATAGGDGGLAHSDQQQRNGRGNSGETGRGEFADERSDGGMGDAISGGRQSQSTHLREHGERVESTGREQVAGFEASSDVLGKQPTTGPTNSLWRAADWLLCRDGKWRPVEPGTFPLVDGLPRGVVPSGDPGSAEYANNTAEARVMRLRGYGNAIVPQMAAEIIRAALDGAFIAELFS